MVSTVTAATAASALKKPIAEDDFESQQKTNAEVCVDYLSYKFDEMDLAASWRVMTKQKKDVVDGIRLENASWRTWAKQRNNLKTISPQTLNWLKDSDVTWLYGPLHTVIRAEEDPFLTPRQATAEDTLGLILQSKTKQQSKKPLKSALKKVTTVDLLKRSATELAINTTKDSSKHRRKFSISQVNDELRAVSPVILASHRQPKLRFNHQVEQCIALTDEEEREHEDIEEEHDNLNEAEGDILLSSSMMDHNDDSSEGDEDTDQIITSHITYTETADGNGIIGRRQSFMPQRKSIKKIAPARLKKSQSDQDTDDASISSTSTASSVGYITSRSPIPSSPIVYDDDEEEEEEEEMDENHSISDFEEYTAQPVNNMDSFYQRPTPGQSLRQGRPSAQTIRSSSSNSITQTYREKTNAAEPALVTMHQTATDINNSPSNKKGDNSTLLNHIATWAASYLWSNNTKRSPSPQASVSTSILPSPTAAVSNTTSTAIPIERHYAPPTSSNASSL
ncbi:protein phosphatase regulator [Mucor circinelloides]